MDNHRILKNVQQNSGMQLDGFFEDFEARFEAELEASQIPNALDSANLIRVVASHEGFVDLVACLLGLDFVAGMALGRNDWQLIRFDAIAEMQFSELRDVPIPEVRIFELPVIEFLERLPLPLVIKLTTLDASASRQCLLLELRGNCLVTQGANSANPVGIPISSIARIHIDSVENFGTDV